MFRCGFCICRGGEIVLYNTADDLRERENVAVQQPAMAGEPAGALRSWVTSLLASNDKGTVADE